MWPGIKLVWKRCFSSRGAELLHTFHLDQDLTTDDIYELGMISSANVRVMTFNLANERHAKLFCLKHGGIYIYGFRTEI